MCSEMLSPWQASENLGGSNTSANRRSAPSICGTDSKGAKGMQTCCEELPGPLLSKIPNE